MKDIFKYKLLTVVFLHITALIHAQFSISPVITNATCPDTSNGSISISVSGGTPPYVYLWKPGGQTTSLVTGMKPGTYSLTVTDNSVKDSIVSYVVAPAPFVNDLQLQNPVCTNNGSIIQSVSGGTPPYQYTWNTGQVTPDLSQLIAGNYSVVVTDANNCTVSYSYHLTTDECMVYPEDHFTPNGDGINDTWLITNSEYFPGAKLIVFDRWGTKVYEHRGLYERWDGKSYLGISVPDAVYYYYFYRDKEEKEKNAKHGSVTIIR